MKNLFFFLLVLLVGAGLWASRQRPTGPGNLPSGTQSDPGSAVTEDGVEVDPASGIDPRRESAENVAISTRSIVGTVLLDDGSPLPSCDISLRGGESQQSGEDGRFAFVDLEPGEYWLEARHSRYVQSPTPPIRIAEHKVEDVTITMQSGHWVTGSTLDRDGAPVGGTSVTVNSADGGSWSVESDDDGAFRVGPTSDGPVTLTAEREGYIGAGRQVLAGGSPQILTLTQLPSIFGSVVDARTGDGIPIESVELHAVTSGRRPRLEPLDDPSCRRGASDSSEFELWPRMSRRFHVVVHVEGYVPVRSELVQLRDHSVGPIQLRAVRGFAVSGVVEDDLGEAVEGATVSAELTGSSSDQQVASQVVTDDQGRFDLRVESTGNYALTVQGAGTAQFDERIDVPTSGLDRGSIVVQRTGRVRLRAVAVSGAARPRMEARLVGSKGHVVAAAERGDRPGIIEFEDVLPGDYRVELAGGQKDGVPTSISVVAGQTNELQIDRSQGRSLRGSLRLNGDLAPNRSLVLRSESMSSTVECVTDREGRFEFASLPQGELTLELVGDRPRSVAYHQMLSASRDTEPLELDLALRTVRGRILEASGDPMEQARVRLIARAGDDDVELMTLSTTASGGFESIPFAFDEVWLHVSAPGRVAVEREVFVGPGQSLDAGDIVLDRSAELEVTLMFSDGTRARPLNWTLEIDGESGPDSARRTVELKNSTTRVRGLPAGSATVRVLDRDGGEVAAETIELTRGEPHSIVLGVGDR